MSNLFSLDKMILLMTKYAGMFGEGLYYTLLLSAITVLFGTLIGSGLCLCKMSELRLGGWWIHCGLSRKQHPAVYAVCSFKPVRFLASAYIEIVRGTPLLLQLYVFYFVLPELLGADFSKFTSICIALALNSAAYVAELVRGGIQAVDRGQTEASRCLGLSRGQTMLHVVLPQAVKNILPALANEFVAVIKETSLASTFFIGDLMTQYKTLSGSLFLILEPLVIVGIIYFVLTFGLSKLIAIMERRMHSGD